MAHHQKNSTLYLRDHSKPSYARELYDIDKQRSDDARFIRAMALAFQRGDHLSNVYNG